MAGGVRARVSPAGSEATVSGRSAAAPPVAAAATRTPPCESGHHQPHSIHYDPNIFYDVV